MSNEDLHKHTLNLRKGDYNKMSEMFPKIKGGAAIRHLVSRFVDKNYSTQTKEVENALLGTGPLDI